MGRHAADFIAHPPLPVPRFGGAAMPVVGERCRVGRLETGIHVYSPVEGASYLAPPTSRGRAPREHAKNTLRWPPVLSRLSTTRMNRTAAVRCASGSTTIEAKA